jgi:hypothetical protein
MLLLPLRAESLKKKNPYAPVKKNGVTRYLIARKYDWHHTQKKVNKTRGKAVWCYVHKDKIVFRADKFNFFGKKWDVTTKIFLLKVRNGRLSCYEKTAQGGWRCSNLNIHLNQIFDGVYIKETLTIKKTHEKRVERIFRNFFKQHKLPFGPVRFSKKVSKDSWDTHFWVDIERNIKLAMYPLLGDLKKDYGIERFELNGLFTKYLRQNSIKVLIRGCFGNHGKVLTKAVIEQLKDGSGVLTTGLLFKGILPVDYIQKIVQGRDHHGFIIKTNIETLRKFFKEFDQRRVLKWVENRKRWDSTLIDTARMYLEYKDSIQNIPVDGTIEEIHNYISKEQRKVKTPNFIFEYSDKQLKMDGLIIDDLRIELPKDSYTLIDYGQKMSNCIGSYAHYVAGKQGVLLGIYKDNVLTYNVEIQKSGHVNQFYTARNQSAPKEDVDKVLNALNNLSIWKNELNHKGRERGIYQPVVDNDRDEHVPAEPVVINNPDRELEPF